jgi:hypothetical protein
MAKLCGPKLEHLLYFGFQTINHPKLGEGERLASYPIQNVNQLKQKNKIIHLSGNKKVGWPLGILLPSIHLVGPRTYSIPPGEGEDGEEWM